MRSIIETRNGDAGQLAATGEEIAMNLIRA
jgi:hypothetical protein